MLARIIIVVAAPAEPQTNHRLVMPLNLLHINQGTADPASLCLLLQLDTPTVSKDKDTLSCQSTEHGRSYQITRSRAATHLH